MVFYRVAHEKSLVEVEVEQGLVVQDVLRLVPLILGHAAGRVARAREAPLQVHRHLPIEVRLPLPTRRLHCELAIHLASSASPRIKTATIFASRSVLTTASVEKNLASQFSLRTPAPPIKF